MLASGILPSTSRTLSALGLASLLVLGLSACSTSSPHPVPITTTGAPTAHPTPQTSAAVTVLPGGIAEASGNKVTDGRGTYETIKVNPAAALLKYQTSVVTADARKQWSKSDILSGQRFILDFVVTQGVDSPTYDGGDAAFFKWVKTDAPRWTVPNSPTLFTRNKQGQLPSIIIDDNAISTPAALRDGGPRQSYVSTQLTQIDGFTLKGGTQKILAIHGVTKVNYRTTNAAIIKAVRAANPTKTIAQVRAKLPQFFEGTNIKPGSATYPMELMWAYALEKTSATPSGWGIAGYSNTSTNTLFQ